MLQRLSVTLAGATEARLVAERLEDPDGVAALATAVIEEDGGRRWRIDAYIEDAPAPAALVGALAGLVVIDGLTIEPVPDENWVAISQAALPPVEAGRFLVHGSHDRQRIAPTRWALEIEAGEAFGTAHHATTEGCLLALDRLAAHWRAPTRVLDLGCGSGVLALAAARIWPQARILASDIDPIAVEVARANAHQNQLRGRVRVVVAGGLERAEIRRLAPYDLVLANILAGPLVRLAPALARRTAPGGRVVLSGILANQAREVVATYAVAGFRLVARRVRLGWCTLVLERVSRRNHRAA